MSDPSPLGGALPPSVQSGALLAVVLVATLVAVGIYLGNKHRG